jgi:hypothetical protein
MTLTEFIEHYLTGNAELRLATIRRNWADTNERSRTEIDAVFNPSIGFTGHRITHIWDEHAYQYLTDGRTWVTWDDFTQMWVTLPAGCPSWRQCEAYLTAIDAR